ncbi:hypothetical protein XELAEV_18014971mg [Xenopus laevis]|uniref:Uncharacterized protein n=1 Tax=Xenopus laevis TaxID=8355 RepID=A0A974DH59_XENLA|nr:hypothetical protein XELAEV_18014971mg [Xenopus laevis]
MIISPSGNCCRAEEKHRRGRRNPIFRNALAAASTEAPEGKSLRDWSSSTAKWIRNLKHLKEHNHQTLRSAMV